MSPDSTPVAKQSVHVVIAGGGPAGTATALALARRGFSSLIVERAACRGVSIGESLPPEVQAALQELGLWERFLADGHRPSLFNLVAWGGPRLSCREHLFSPYGQGWHVDRGRFDALLTAVARERGALIIAGARMESVARSADGGWRIEIAAPDGRREIRAAWLVDATGRSATLSRHLGGRRVRADRLVGVTAFLTPRPGAAPLEPAILVEAEEEGWWYSAPLPDGRAVAALLTDAGQPDSAALRSPAGWGRRLDATLHTRRRLSRYRPPEATIVRAAEPALTEMPSCPGFLPVGDAAAAFDPLSGMGVLAALRGGIEAAAAIAGSDAGDPEALLRYEDQVRRRFHDHLRLREEYYAKELRWPESLFWSRRRVPGSEPPRLRLDPERILAVEPDEESRWALDRLEERHPDLRLRAVCAVCRQPAPAHQIVRALLAEPASTAGTLRAIRSLEILIEHGVVTAFSPDRMSNFSSPRLTA